MTQGSDIPTHDPLGPNADPAPSDSPNASTNPTDNLACPRCAYRLDGLEPTGLCPECGLPIQQAIEAASSLRYAPIEYIQRLRGGVKLVLYGIIATIIVNVIAAVVSGYLSFNAASQNPGNLTGTTPALMITTVISQSVALLCAIAIAVGWWTLTTPLPGGPTANDPATPRKIVRTAIIISIIADVLSLGFIFLPAAPPGSLLPIIAISVAVGGIDFIAGAVAFFAQMLYIKWLAQSLQHEKAFKRAKTMLWLGPVLVTFGLLLFGLGPLIALILYWNLLDWIRKDLKKIATQQAAPA